MTEHAVINKPLYFVISLCAVDASFYKLVNTLFHHRYIGEFYGLKNFTYIFRPSVHETLRKVCHKSSSNQK